MNPMMQVRLEKVALNMGSGTSTQRLEASKKILEKLTGRKVMITKTRKRTTFNVPKNKPIGAMVTVRGGAAAALLKRLMQANENLIAPSQFDRTGNFSFGVKEYIHVPGMTYEPTIGIVGLDVAVTLERRGFRVKRKGLGRGVIGKNHRITPEEALTWARQFGFLIKESGE